MNSTTKTETHPVTSTDTRATHPGSAACLIREADVNHLDAEQVIQYAEQSQKKPLPETEKETIRKTFAKDDSLAELTRLHNQFIDIKTNFDLLPGLDEQQKTEAHRLIEEIRNFKSLRQKGNVSIGDMKKVLIAEKALLPLNQTIEWWTANQNTLKKLSIWENMTEMIVNSSKEKRDDDQSVRTKIHHLTDIKNDWISHQVFSSFSSENLLNFYQDFICKMQTWLTEALTSRNSHARKWHPAIRQYLNFLLYEINNLKKSAIQSMYFRLVCAEYHNDINMDDLISHVCGQINEKCDINILGQGKRPETRHSLTTPLISAFVGTINDYVRTHPDEKIIQHKLHQLRFQAVPHRWKSPEARIDESEAFRAYPVILFSANTLPLLIEEAHKNPRLAQNALESGHLASQSHLLNRMRSLMLQVEQEEGRIRGNKPGVLRDRMLKITAELKKVYGRFLEELSIKIEIEVKRLISDITEQLLNSSKPDLDVLSGALEQVSQAELFFRNFMHEDYHAASDFVLAIAAGIKHTILTSQDLKPEQINNIIQFIQYVTPQNRKINEASLKMTLAKISASAIRLNEENEAGLLHLLAHAIESPFLTQESMVITVARHKHIADMYGESWSQAFNVPAGSDARQTYSYSLCAYARNVILKICALSPYIDFDNFDDNEVLHLLENIRQDCACDTQRVIPGKETFTSLRVELEKCILGRLNDLFLIKSYLYSRDSNSINIERLEKLMSRINKFFSDNECRKVIIESLLKSILSMIKQYCIQCIEKNEAIDMKYLSEITALAGEDPVAALTNDKDVLKLLSAYMDTYDGTTNLLSPLLIHLVGKPASPAHDSLITRYAKKRLEYLIYCKEATGNDYLFFSQYASHPVISDMFQDARRQLSPYIQSVLENAKATWKPDAASMIELCGDEKAVYSYRLKKILEFTAPSALRSRDDKAAAILFDIFRSTLNPRYSVSNSIIDIKTPVDTHTSLKARLDHLIASEDWSLLLEKVTGLCGTPEQAQALHFRHTLQYLQNPADFSGTWLGLTLLNETAAKTNASQQPDQASLARFYTQFYGDKNIRKLTEQIEVMLKELITVNHRLNTTVITHFEYKKLLAVIACLLPLAPLYTLHGGNDEAKAMLSELKELQKKIRLHYQMNTVIKQQSSLLGVSENHIELHNLILSIIQTISKIERKQILSAQNINQYLAFFDQEILLRVDTILSQDNPSLNFQALFTLANLMQYLASDNLKLMLLNANTKYLENNPYWYTLINHLDQKKYVADLENLSQKTDPFLRDEKNFQHALLFAKHLTEIKSRTHQMIQETLVREAGIDTRNQKTDNFKALFIDSRIKNKQLLKLWNACAEKLQIENLNSHVKVQYIHFLVKLLARISDAILARAKNSNSLLKTYLKRLPEIEKIQSAMQTLDQEADKTNPAGVSRFLWQARSEFKKSVQPLITSVHKAVSLRMIFKMEKFVFRILKKDQINQFREYCHNARFHDNKINALTTLPELKKIFSLEHDVDAARLSGLISLYALLDRTFTNGKDIRLVSNCLEQLIAEPRSNPRLPHSKNYISLLQDLNAIMQSYFTPANDSHLRTLQRTKSILHRK